MRTDLPTTSALIKLVYVVDGETRELTKHVLVADETRDHITCIRSTGVTQVYSKYRGVISETPTVKSVEFVDDDSAEYRELVSTIRFADMTEALDKLASKVSIELNEIISVCPENKKDLMAWLTYLVGDEEESE